MKKITLNIKGMHCASCAANITKYLQKQPGIKSTQINFTTQKGLVEFDESLINEDTIKTEVKKTGYEVVDSANHDHEHFHDGEKNYAKIKAFLALALALPLILRMFWAWEIPGTFWGINLTDWAQHDLAFIVVFILGWQFHRNAFRALKKGQTDMDTLISLGTLSAYFYSLYAMFAGTHLYFEGAASIAALILLGRFLEQKTKDKASQAMQKLIELGVKNATVIGIKGQEIKKSVEDITVGEIIKVKPSEKIPLDGVVIEGKSSIDESMLTGESLPVFKNINSEVFSATINKDGMLKIKVTKEGKNSVLAQIIKTVEEAQNFKAPVQKLADKISSIFVPVVVGISMLTFLGWLLSGASLGNSIIYAVAVLVISCPCALGIATPIAILVGSSVGAKNGILIKNGESFERAKKIDAIIFDKTGTLTKGQPVVQKLLINTKIGFQNDNVLKIAASVAQNSEHPLSQAVTQYAKKENIPPVEVYNFKEIPGKGVKAYCAQHKSKFILGNIKHINDNHLDDTWAQDIARENKKTGGTMLFIGHNKKLVGALLIADELKRSAHTAIQEVKNLGIEPMLVSGDNKHAVSSIANDLGIEKFYAEVLPQEKQAKIKEIQTQGKKVIFAGDGINDAPALVQSDLGIAMASGTDIAKESGDIIIMKNEPIKIVDAIKLSQKTFSIIKMNLFWAFFYNILAIPLAMAGFVSPMIAALAMSFSDITVIGNSLRIYRK